MPKLSQNDDTDNIATFPRPKCPANLDVKNLTYVKNLSFGGVCSIFEVPCTEDEGIDVPEIICEVCKDVPKYFQNVNHIEICIAFCKSCKDCKACEFCRSFRMIVFSCIRELPRPDEQAGADEKIAKIVGSGEGSGARSGDTSTLAVEENAMKNNSKHHCRWVWCCPSRHICYERKDRIQNARKCVKSWCCSYLQYCQLRSGNKLYHKY